MTVSRTFVPSSVAWLRSMPIEALFWTIGLVSIASIDPTSTGGINLCLIENLGLPCPGDGLGRGIAYLVRGEWAASWNAHRLAAPVVMVLVYHIVSLCRTSASRSR